MRSGRVFNIQKYSIHDGPGIRTTVFLKGCPLSCAWCHNPEGIAPEREIIVADHRCAGCGECRTACPLGGSQAGEGPLPVRRDGCTLCGACVNACPSGARQMIGRVMTVPEAMEEILEDRIFYEESGGGATISGGEPLMQPDFLEALLAACRAEGIHTAIDTAGCGSPERLRAAAELADLVLYDLKALDEERHRQLTGASNRSILENLQMLDRVHGNIWIRVPVVPGFNADLDLWRGLAAFAATLRHVTRVDLLPFHPAGAHKYARLGRANLVGGIEPPTAETMAAAVRIFAERGLPVKTSGKARELVESRKPSAQEGAGCGCPEDR